MSEESRQGLQKLQNLLGSSWNHQPQEEAIIQLDDADQQHVVSLNFGSKRLRNRIDVTAFDHFPHLHTLNLGGTDLPVADIIQILDKVAPSIQCLFLGGNGLRNDGIMALAHFLSSATQLVKLDLRYNDIGAWGLQAWPTLPTTLRFLYFEGNNLQDDGAAVLAKILQSSKVEHVFLGANQIGPAGAHALAHILPQSNITKLYLEGNHIGMEGAEHFIRVLERGRSTIKLQHLYVDNNDIGKEGSKRLAQALNLDAMIEDASSSQ